jgi:hypothetical protein
MKRRTLETARRAAPRGRADPQRRSPRRDRDRRRLLDDRGLRRRHEQETTLYDISAGSASRGDRARRVPRRPRPPRARRRARPPQLRPRHEDVGRATTSRGQHRRPRARRGLPRAPVLRARRPERPDAQRMAVKMQRGVVNQASFAFTIGDEELVEDITNDERRRQPLGTRSGGSTRSRISSTSARARRARIRRRSRTCAASRLRRSVAPRSGGPRTSRRSGAGITSHAKQGRSRRSAVGEGRVPRLELKARAHATYVTLTERSRHESRSS